MHFMCRSQTPPSIIYVHRHINITHLGPSGAAVMENRVQGVDSDKQAYKLNDYGPILSRVRVVHQHKARATHSIVCPVAAAEEVSRTGKKEGRMGRRRGRVELRLGGE